MTGFQARNLTRNLSHMKQAQYAEMFSLRGISIDMVINKTGSTVVAISVKKKNSFKHLCSIFTAARMKTDAMWNRCKYE
jgi:hypothetical protein